MSLDNLTNYDLNLDRPPNGVVQRQFLRPLVQAVRQLDGEALRSVAHDATLQGEGTDASPLSVVSTGNSFSYETVAADFSVTVPLYQQMIVSGEVDVMGTLTVNGSVVII